MFVVVIILKTKVLILLSVCMMYVVKVITKSSLDQHR